MTSEIRIKKASMQELDAISACAVDAYQLYVERIGKKPAPMIADFAKAITTQTVYVACSPHIIGFVVFFPRGDHMHIENIAIHPTAQGKGLGKRLISFVEQQAATMNIKAVELYTNEKMTENLSFYPKLGDREVKRKREDGFSRVYFRKELGGR